MAVSEAFVPASDLPQLPESWRWARLGDLVDQSRGICYGIVQPGKHDDAGVPMVNSQDVLDGSVASRIEFRVARKLHDRFKRSTIRGGEILLTLVGANFGRVAITPTSFAGYNCSRAVGVVPVAENAEFVMFALRSPLTRRFMDNWANRTAQPTFNLKEVANLPVPIPPLPEQKAIAEVLGALDDKIELNRRMNATLEAMARALFQSWFVDFDPVRANMARRDRSTGEQGVNAEDRARAGLDEPTAALFPAQFQDSELGPIPQGWEVGKLGEVAVNPRRGVNTDEIEAAAAYIGLEHMPRRCIALTDWDTAEGLESNKSEFKKGEILFGKLRPYFHKVGVAPLDGVCSTDILVVSPTKPEWFGFVLGHISSVELVNHTDALSTGTKMPRTKWQDIAGFDVTLPPSDIAAAFTRQVNPLVEQIIANIHQSRILATLRDTLLPGLLSGRKRIECFQPDGIAST